MNCKRNVDTFMVKPNEKQLHNTKNELGENEDRLKHGEALLFTWINCQPHFPKNYDKNMVRNFLRSCKYNVEKTKKKLEFQFRARTVYSNILSNRNPLSQDVIQAIENLNMVILPKLTKEGNRISIFRLEKDDASNFNILAITKLCFMTYDMVLTSEHPVCGDVTIIDGTHFSPGYLIKLFSLLKIIITILKEAYAIRLKQIHIINGPPAVETIITTIKPLLPKNVQKSIMVHKNQNDLLNYFSSDLLPCNYGGKMKPLRSLTLEWHQLLIENTEWFQNQEKCKIIGTLPKNVEESVNFQNQLMGLEGSFRKLEID